MERTTSLLDPTSPPLARPRTLAAVRAAERRGRDRPLIVEVIGPAGAGKSTLVRMLTARIDTIRRCGSLRLATDLPLILRRAPRWLPVVARLAAATPGVAREYSRHLVRVAAIDGVLRRNAPPGTDTLLLDEGPVFSMALMLAFSERSAASELVVRHVMRTADRWASILDAVVWLDAEDAMLTERIRARDKAHRIKAADDAVARAFLARYRGAFDAITARLEASAPLTILRADTGATSLTAVAADVVAMLAELRDGD